MLSSPSVKYLSPLNTGMIQLINGFFMTDHLNCKVFDFVPQELLRSNNHYGDSVAFSIPEVRGRHCEALSYSD